MKGTVFAVALNHRSQTTPAMIAAASRPIRTRRHGARRRALARAAKRSTLLARSACARTPPRPSGRERASVPEVIGATPIARGYAAQSP